jgi:hypothetical protein
MDERAGIVYLETRVKGNAWDLIKHDLIGAKHYLDILDAMDVYFKQETYEKVIEAENPYGIVRCNKRMVRLSCHRGNASWRSPPVLRGQTRDEEEPVEINPDVEDDADYSVEAIEDCRINNTLSDPYKRSKSKRGLLQYKVRWANYPEGPDNPTWEPYMNLLGSGDIIYEYHRDHLDKPGLHHKFKTLVDKQDLMLIVLVYSSDRLTCH